MTETKTASEPGLGVHPADILFNLVVAFLVPMFLTASQGDITYARLAAIETVNGYGLRRTADLITIAQIIAFGLAALGSLSLSLADDVSVKMALRLRGNATSCNRAAEQNRRALRQSHDSEPRRTEPAIPEHDPHPDEA